MATAIKSTIITPVTNWFTYHFYIKKFNTPVGWTVIGLIGAALALSGTINSKLPVLIALAAGGILFVLVALQYPEFGLLATIVLSALTSLPERLFYSFAPWPVITEALTYLLLIAVIAKQYRLRLDMKRFWRWPITLAFVVLLLYYVLDIFNPQVHNISGVTNFIRKQFGLFTFYFVCYFVINSYRSVVRFMYVWLALVMFIAIYGIKQQWIGFSDKELNWLMMIPERYELFNQSGFVRKFSVLNDPAAFGTLCASSSVFTLVLAVRASSKRKRNLFYLCTVLLVIAGGYSGTRTSNLMLGAGILAYVVFTLSDKKTYMLVIGVVFFALFMLFGPFRNNLVVLRVKSTFEGTKDASAGLRDINRHRIQPYLHKNPMGGGIGTCGIEGAIYNPTHYLTNFQPDSGYMKILAEQGWIGLLLQLIFYFIFLQRGIYGYFHSKNPEIKTWYIATVTGLFSLLAGQYSQIAIAPYPQILYYIAAMVILYKLKDYDTPTFETTASAQQVE
jgi:putative inorganic carbon (hco3(-)) transporter